MLKVVRMMQLTENENNEPVEYHDNDDAQKM